MEVAPTMRTSNRIRSKPDRYGFPHKVLHITVRKCLQQYGGKAHISIMAKLLQLVDKMVFTPVEAGKLLPGQMKKATGSSMFLKLKVPPRR